jgi:hypothetical protein
MPVQISVNGLFSNRFDNFLPSSLAWIDTSPFNSIETGAAGVRLLAAPTLKLNEHWFLHATFSANTEPFYPYEAYHVNRARVQGHLIQGYAGYTLAGDRKNLTIKAGKLATAFGALASRYSDLQNPLVDAPQPYGSYLLLRPNSIPCSNYDLEHQQQVHPNVSAYHCTRPESYSYGILPVTPYGLTGAEVSVNFGKVDARIQLTNSSPSNPQSVFSKSQAAQWAGGGGVTLWRGLRVGASGFRGPWLDRDTDAYIGLNRGWRAFHSSGVGVDAQFSQGRWSVNGEWMRLRYEYPDFAQQPRVTYAYVEAKAIVSARFFLAARVGSQAHGQVQYGGTGGHPAEHSHHASFQPNKQAFEAGAGYRPHRELLVKFSQQWVRRSPAFGPSDNISMLQLVVSLPETWTNFAR